MLFHSYNLSSLVKHTKSDVSYKWLVKCSGSVAFSSFVDIVFALMRFDMMDSIWLKDLSRLHLITAIASSFSRKKQNKKIK